mmetsp:Transcript_108318/g.187099  ORF Transcript_108318/g.187099 Transcript_108318/m.187099 type:complete len:745 (-) Transcript_108318:746-2980(-)
MVKSHVQVLIRTRPTDKFASNCLNLADDGKTVHVHMAKKKKPGRDDFVNNQQEDFTYKYDRVMHNVTQEAIYNQVGSGIVRSVLDGYNGTALCYGQTGAGKTYTMSGGNDFKQRGMVPRAIANIFNDITNKPEQSFEVRVSYMEIYNERLFDLLADPASANPDDLHIQEDAKGSISVKNLSTPIVTQEADALAYFFEGNANRAIAEHQLNTNSSRSHCVFTVYVSCRSRVESDGQTTHSKLNFVDLAGSERLSKSGSEGQVAKEAMYINKSLTFLEQVVIALSTSAREHVPYRQCRLTNLLKDSLGGNCKTVMVANIWAEEQHLEETVSTLKFATRMMRVQNEVTQNVSIDAQAQIRNMAKEIAELKSELQMQNQLHGKSHITYSEEYTDDERFELQTQVRDYCDGKTPEIDIKSLRQVKEMFRIFKQLVETAELEGGPRRSSGADGGPLKAAPGTPGDENSEEGVGDVETSGGFGIGTAIPAKLDKTAKENARQQNAVQGQPHARDLSTEEPARESMSPADMPNRNDAFEMYKSNDGYEVAELLKRSTASLREKKKQFKEYASKVNACKAKIDELRLKVQAKKEEDDNNDDDVVDVEYFRALTSLKEQKQAYRLVHEEMAQVKSEMDYETRMVEQARSKLIVEFTQWYDSTYGAGDESAGGMPPIGSGSAVSPLQARTPKMDRRGFDEDVLDDGEKFENMERARIMAEDPDSTVYYSAKKNAAMTAKSQGAAVRKAAAVRAKR